MTCAGYICPADPRRTDCLRCARPEASHPQPEATTRYRDMDDERRITYEAARTVVDGTALIQFSETRASRLSGEYVNDPGLVKLGRDRLRDTREELSDARNHIVWFIQEHPATERAQDAHLALRHILLAYDLLCRED